MKHNHFQKQTCHITKISYSQPFWSNFPKCLTKVKKQIFNQAVLAKTTGTLNSTCITVEIVFKYLKELKIDIKLSI